MYNIYTCLKSWAEINLDTSFHPTVILISISLWNKWVYLLGKTMYHTDSIKLYARVCTYILSE